jgi:hypothetical protein
VCLGFKRGVPGTQSFGVGLGRHEAERREKRGTRDARKIFSARSEGGAPGGRRRNPRADGITLRVAWVGTGALFHQTTGGSGWSRQAA